MSDLLAPIARSLFAWNHDVVIGWGRRGAGEAAGVRGAAGDRRM